MLPTASAVPSAPATAPRRRSGSTPLPAALLVGMLALASACTGDHAGQPVAPPPSADVVCGPGGTVSPASLHGVTVNCSQGGTMVDLAGNGANYLLVPQFATSDAANSLVSYAIGVTTASTAMGAITPSMQVASDAPAPSASWLAEATALPGRHAGMQARFDRALRLEAMDAVRSGRWRRTISTGAAPSLALSTSPPAPPPLNSVRTFRVLSTFSTSNPAFKSVGAQLEYAGASILIYVDTLAPANGFSSGALGSLGALLDQTLYPIDLAAFGPPSDIDGNGRLLVLMSPVVNALSKSADCATQGFIGGFFDGIDLASSSTNSNNGELFYTIVPDPSGTVSCAHSVQDMLRVLPATFLHEVQHLINFSQHVVARHSDAEEGWLDEGLSIVAEELGSIYYEQRFPPPTGRTNPLQLFPDSSQGFISSALFDSYQYLLEPDTAAVTLHSDADGGLAWRGSVWLLVRWLADQKGASILRRLVESSLTGTSNIEAAAGESFPSLFGDFGVALYTDSLSGVARDAVPARDRFLSRNLRQMYAALFRAGGPSADVPRQFPIVPASLGTTQTTRASMVPGTMSFYRLDVPSGMSSVRLRFAAPDGSALPSSLHPQIGIFRLP